MERDDQISLDTLWDVLERCGRLPENFDREEEKKKIAEKVQTKQDNLLKQFNGGEFQ
jgi:hypothetical protein